jgi:hypothetical protein
MSLRKIVLSTTAAALMAGSLFLATPASAENTLFAEANLPAPEILIEQDDAVSLVPFSGSTSRFGSPVLIRDSQSAPSMTILKSANASGAASASAEGDEAAEPVAAIELFGNEPIIRSVEMVAIEKAIAEARAAKAAAERAAAFSSKVSSMTNGNAGQLTGMYVQNSFAMNVGEFWQFGMAAQHGSLGLLAHNYAGGGNFFSLSVGSVINLVYGDGSIRKYQVTKVRRFEALQPNSPTSQFIDLDRGGGKQSVTKVFNQIYNSSNPLVLQTCIANHGVSTWGRLFVIAVPIG